ncbi:tetratricopeptide repeat protein [Winogradskyella psychrotolerans]|uniref:tetratricopeptide repeat protein n=1 Tax=Winogradskyella psychrotolerans TaxID=1344585 RepID=UPI001C078173|nr:tetratricopeptide repeat protein [Winogradskyella psychrotolerans]MBU2930278.1 cell surface protein [Winogradskyella psychrotolerans]
MKLKNILPIFITLLMLSCNSNTVTNQADYSPYFSTEIDRTKLLEDVNFWTTRIENSTSSYSYLISRANANTEVFNVTGEIDYLIKAEEDLLEANKIVKDSDAGLLKNIAANYISQHRFKEALVLLKKAEANGAKLNGTKKMLFDVHLELGNYIYAEAYLKDLKNTSSFDYLIRLSKLEDHKGNLDGAIEHMEKAMAIAESSNLKGMKLWSYTNIADFYGHAGDIDKSYSYFLKALELDPNNAYAKKGIAWIVYSHEKNPEEALNILNHITSYHNTPDYDLLKAEIAEYNNDLKLKAEFLTNYQAAVKNDRYGAMYNKYNVMVFSEDLLIPERALEIAMQEVENRPTPQSYDLLAWSYFKLGDIKRANNITEEFVDGKTFEPAVLYHVAEIYKAAGKTAEIQPLKTELLASIYELGPTMVSKINQL